MSSIELVGVGLVYSILSIASGQQRRSRGEEKKSTVKRTNKTKQIGSCPTNQPCQHTVQNRRTTAAAAPTRIHRLSSQADDAASDFTHSPSSRAHQPILFLSSLFFFLSLSQLISGVPPPRFFCYTLLSPTRLSLCPLSPSLFLLDLVYYPTYRL